MSSQPTLKTQAEILFHCLYGGFVTKDEVIAWADRQLERTPRPDIELIEVAMSGKRHIIDVANLLKEIQGDVDSELVYQGVFDAMLHKLNENPALERHIIRILFEMAQENEAPNEAAKAEMYHLDYAFSLAIEGFGSLADVSRDLHGFLRRYATNGSST